MTVEKDIEANNAGYKEQKKKDFKKAIVESLKESKIRKNTPPNLKIIKRNGTRKNKLNEMAIKGAILSNMHQSEKHTLESQLPPELNGAMVDIIERDGHCFFRSITHQLRAYGFNVPTEYQTVRNLVAEYIENSDHITLDMIRVESPNYTSRTQYTNALRQGLWGGKIEIIAIHGGCLSRLTDGQFLRINIYSVNNGQIELHPGFIGTRPDDEGEQVIERWPIRLLYVGNNHFHRIYFNDINFQKLDYQDEVRPAELISGQHIDPDTGMTLDEKARQLEAYKHFQKDESATPINDSPSQWSCSQCTYLNDAETANCAACEAALNKANLQINNEWGLSKEEIQEQLQGLEKYNNNKIVIVDKDSDEYVNLEYESMKMPFMIMGYQNGNPNLLYKSIWSESKSDDISMFTGDIYIPNEVDINNRKYTRYPNSSMLNVNGKTIVNISLHRWANIWDEDNNVPLNVISQSRDSGSKFLSIQMTDAKGVDEVIGPDGADFKSISLTKKEILYMRHGIHGMSFSPDTGVIALDDNDLNPSCSIIVRDPTDGRTLKLKLNFHRIEYMPPSDKVPVYDMFGAKVVPGKKTPGGKSRRTRKLCRTRKSRKQRRRRQTKRR